MGKGLLLRSDAAPEGCDGDDEARAMGISIGIVRENSRAQFTDA